jgi:hypothetical protein
MKSRMCTRCDAVVMVLCAIFLLMVVGAVGEQGREQAFRQTCAQNLAAIGKGLLVYSADYRDELPKAGGAINAWVPTLPDWHAQNRTSAYALTRSRRGQTTIIEGQTTATSSLYLLVKYSEIAPKRFVCPSEPDTREFTRNDVREKLPDGYELIDAWDFGGRYDDRNNPSRHCSYAYHMPFDRSALTVANDPGMAVAADRNPWMDPNRVRHATQGWAAFTARNSDRADPITLRLGNSDAHRRDGQNVFFMDTHVSFETQPTCGADNDDIYTIAPGKSDPAGERPLPPRVYDTDRPAHRKDSVLVQEAPFVVREPAGEEKPKAGN